MEDKQQGLDRVSQQARLMYAVLEQDGPQPTKYFQQDRSLADGRRWQWSRADYPTGARTELESEGLIRTARKRQGTARVYEITPAKQIAEQRARFKRQQTKSRQLGRPLKGASGRVAYYRKLERELGTLSRARWIEARRRVVELSRHLKYMHEDQGMVFWKNVPADELAIVYEEVLAMKSWAEDVLNSCDIVRGDAETRDLILKLRNTNGRPPEEIPLFAAKADELEAKLLT